MVLDKEDAHARKGIFMIDASKGFMKDGPKNRLRAQDIHKIVDAFNKRLEIPRYSRMVSLEQIEKNDYNLNVPRYIDSTEPEDLQDIDGHLRAAFQSETLTRSTATGRFARAPADAVQGKSPRLPRSRRGEVSHQVDNLRACGVRRLHRGHERALRRMATEKHRDTRQLKAGCHPKEVIANLSEDLLAHYTGKPLIDHYDVYQHLMDYWAETMQDDCYLIAADGWKAETYRIIEKDKKGKEKDKGWTCDLVPKSLIVARYFAKEQEAIDELTTDLESLTARMTELEEEHAGEEGALSSVGSKADALTAWHEAILAVWQSSDATTFQPYMQAVAQQDQARHRLMELETDPRLSALIDAKRKLTQAIINARHKATDDPDELALLENHTTTVAALKEARECTRELLDAATTSIEKRLQNEPESEDHRDLRVLRAYLELTDRISERKKALKEAENDLDAKAYAHYPKLTEDEIKTLVVDDKWLAAIDAAIHGEMDRISQALTQRLKELAERYETPMPHMVSRVVELEDKVNHHLEKMGFSWD